ncbi:MAG: C2 family cysteine protease, partial [Polyangiaceae bacterium]
GVSFVNGIAAENVVQGTLGDCFFLASLAAVARADPAAILNALVENPDGTYTVTLHGAGGRDVRVHLDAALPATAAGDEPFGRSLTPGELWPALYEKAYAKLCGGYAVLNRGGLPDQALAALTGVRAHYRTLSTLSANEAWAMVTGALAARDPVVTSTPEARTLRSRTGRADMAGLIDDHTYAVLDASVASGVRTLRLYSPLLPADVGGPPAEPRAIDIAFDDWKADFDEIVVGSP